jgi:Septum formation
MVAPAGVNEEIPREPAKAGLAQAEPAEGQPAAAPEGKLTDAAPGEAGLAETDLAETELAETELVEAGHAEGEPAEAELAEAGPADAELAGTDAELAGTDAELAGTDAELAGTDAELAGTGEPGLDAAQEHRDVSPLAVAGIILGILALVGAAVGVLAVITHGFRPKTVITYRPAAVFRLRPGECINSAGNGLNVTVLSCATPHDAEVFATFSLPEGPWPGASAVQQDAGNGCDSRLGGYLNPQLATAALGQEYVYPDQAAWQAGERTVVCEVRSVSGQLTGSVRAPN